jgi:hypothetical protein
VPDTFAHFFIFYLFVTLLKVTAQDKASGKTQKITITSDRGRLSEEDINRMVKEAEENAEVDRIAKENIEAKNQLESYLYGVRTSFEDTLKDKIPASDKEKGLLLIKEALTWLEGHLLETKLAYDEKRKEVEVVVAPIISTAYSASSPPTGPSSSSTSSAEDANDGNSNDSDESKNDDNDGGPTVEEVN